MQDITEILVNECGTFAGLKQSKVVLPVQNCLLLSFRVEGTDWYGTPLLENARETWNDWRDANRGAARYDRKVAGAHWVVRYPQRQEIDATGRTRESADMAQEVLSTLEASGSIALLNEPTAGDPANPSQQWLIELLEDAGGRQPTFVERLRYLDSLMARATLIPERSVLEGQYGTKAEAGEQIDLALTHADLAHRHVTRLVNWHAVDQLLAINWGDEYRGTVRLVASPIRDAKLQYVRTCTRRSWPTLAASWKRRPRSTPMQSRICWACRSPRRSPRPAPPLSLRDRSRSRCPAWTQPIPWRQPCGGSTRTLARDQEATAMESPEIYECYDEPGECPCDRLMDAEAELRRRNCDVCADDRRRAMATIRHLTEENHELRNKLIHSLRK